MRKKQIMQIIMGQLGHLSNVNMEDKLDQQDDIHQLFDVSMRISSFVNGRNAVEYYCVDNECDFIVNIGRLSNIIKDYIPFYNSKRFGTIFLNELCSIIKIYNSLTRSTEFVTIIRNLLENDSNKIGDELVSRYSKYVNSMIIDSESPISLALNEIYKKFLYCLVRVDYRINQKKLYPLLSFKRNMV